MRGTVARIDARQRGPVMRAYHPRFARYGFRPSSLLLIDSFAYVRGPRWSECFLQQVVEHLFFAGDHAVAIVLGGARVLRGDYERMFAFAGERYFLGGLRAVLVVSMGNDLIASTRPMRVADVDAGDIVSALGRLRALFSSARAALVYGGSGIAWGYAPDVSEPYDARVAAILRSAVFEFDYATSGAAALVGVSPVDAIGHLSVDDAYASGRLLLVSLRGVFRSRL